MFVEDIPPVVLAFIRNVCIWLFKLHMYTLSIPATYKEKRPVKFNVLWNKLQN